MVKYTFKRLLWMIPIVLGVGFLVFTILYFTPGDPVDMIAGSAATEEERDVLRTSLGLDQPYPVQLVNFFKETFLEFDLGQSYITKVSVASELLVRLPRTLLLTIMCCLLSLLIGIPIGVTAATHQNGFLDNAVMFGALLGVSIPNFWLALLLVLLFAVKLEWLPAMGIGGFQNYILPALAGSVGGIALMARQTRSSMLEIIRSDFITTARAKGVKESIVIYKHALRNALIPVVTLAGNQFGVLLGGTMILETIFAIPGVGSYIITNGIGSRDLPIIRGGAVFLAITFSFCMLLVDLLYAAVDPRIKAQFASKGGKRKWLTKKEV